jgi:WD40 repeat protein
MMGTLILFIISIQMQAEEKPEIVIQKGHSFFINSVAISRDGKYIASGNKSNTVHLWNAQTGEEIRTFAGHKSKVTSVALSGVP